jgi:ABC-type polysaccharide/polyol phosphate transport system ATPase subunit
MSTANEHDRSTGKPSLSAPERPIQSNTEDALERGPFVRRLADALVNAQTNKATGVVIGITGSWGSGKSSILNLLREQIEATRPSALVIHSTHGLSPAATTSSPRFLRSLLPR